MIAQNNITGRETEKNIVKLKLKFPLLTESEINMLSKNIK